MRATLLTSLVVGASCSLAASFGIRSTASAQTDGRVAVADAPVCHPHIEVLPDLGGPYAQAIAFNNAGTYVGAAVDPPSRGAAQHATYWDGAGIHVIRTGLVRDGAVSINADAEMVGFGADPAGGGLRSWIYENGHVHFLRGLGGAFTRARRINDDGIIAGTSVDAGGNQFAVEWRNWSERPMVLQPARGDSAAFGSGINNRDEVAGETDGPVALGGPPRPAVWNAEHHVRVLRTLPKAGFPYGYLYNINDDKQASGDLGNNDGSVVHAARWNADGSVEDLGVLPGGTMSNAFGIAENGWVVGNSIKVDSTGNPVNVHAVFWPGHGPLLALPGLSGSYATDSSNVHGVSSAGTVSGFSTDRQGIGRATVWFCAQQLAFRPQS